MRALCLTLFLSVSLSLFSQITVTVENTPLRAALKKIEQVSDYKFFYNEKLAGLDQPVSFNVSNATIEQTLQKVLAGKELTYKMEKDNVVALFQKEAANQKTKTISGTIIDESGEPVIGASVVVEGTGNGTITNVDGQYALANVPENASIIISFIGYRTSVLKANDHALAKVILKEDSKLLDEVVVIGYGVQNKRDVSTSISSVKSDQLADNSASDFRQALAGKMPGVQVTLPSGDPEGSVSIRVRGVSTVNAGSDPLYIIDGVPMERGFSNLNNNDIESVEVLKDASSAAIYGSRGSNGVILITTKQGKSEKVTIQYDGYYGIQNVSKKLSMMNAYQFAEFAKDGHDNAYLDANPGASADDLNGMRPNSWERIPTELFPYLNGDKGLIDTDWQDAIFRSAMTTGHNVSLSGRGKSVGYFVSANYTSKEGVVINSDFKKYGLRMNLDGKYKKFKFGVNFSPSYSTSNRVKTSGANGIVQSALMMPPTWPVYNPDGSYNYQGNGYWRIGNDYQHNAVLNPVAMANLQSDVFDKMSMVGRVFAEIEFFKGFSYNVSLGGDYYGEHNDAYRSSELPLLGQQYYDKKSNPIGYSASEFYFNWLIENKFSYNTVIGGAHSINAILVQSAQKETYKANNVQATDYPNDYIQTITGGTVTKGASDKTQWSIASYLARVQYSYNGKYIVSGAIRADGSSRFGKNNRWGYFPSASAAWRVSEESFFQKTKWLSFISDAKIRASYGVTGNFQIGNYDHLSLMGNDDYVLGENDGKLTSGYKPNTIKNEELSWEKNAMINAGIDLQMFQGLLGITVDYYNTNTSDMLLKVPVPQLTGYSTTLMNVGKVNNRGWEVALTSQKNFTKDFGYSFSANYSKNTNEVKELGPGNTPIISAGSVDHAYYITEVGKPISSYYLLVQDGIFANEEELKRYPHFDNTHPGDFRFVDVDGDGVMDLDKDRTIVGNYMPDFTYGFGGKVWYKGLDLNFSFQGVQGNKILNLNRRYIDNLEGNTNGTTIALDRWKSEENPGNGLVNRANRKSKGYNGRTSTWHLEDGSYLRLQNVTLGYTLPEKLTRRFLVNKLRVYVSGENLCTFTNYSGYNPEVNSRPLSPTELNAKAGKSPTIKSPNSVSLSPGEDYGTYPLSRTFMFGLNITL